MIYTRINIIKHLKKKKITKQKKNKKQTVDMVRPHRVIHRLAMQLHWNPANAQFHITFCLITVTLMKYPQQTLKKKRRHVQTVL